MLSGGQSRNAELPFVRWARPSRPCYGLTVWPGPRSCVSRRPQLRVGRTCLGPSEVYAFCLSCVGRVAGPLCADCEL